MNSKTLKQNSKFLSLILRHQPETIGVELDTQGWLDIELLISQTAKLANRSLSRELIEQIVRENDKQRFSLSEDGKKIRANQGHSLREVELELSPTEPPETLYHGTVEKSLDAIQKNGLLKMQRNHVHLSPDEKTATNVGSRRGHPILLKVSAKKMFEKGRPFYLSKNGVWLPDHVPPEFIRWPE